jgi:hypothetical protein
MPDSQSKGGQSQPPQSRVGQQSRKKMSGQQQQENASKGQQGSSSRGGTHEQHMKAGQQSHKNR